MSCGSTPMGLGRLRNTTLKRKFRWTFVVNNICKGGSIPASFVKLASRPNLSVEETEINYLNAKTWIPGKGTWETITVTYYDVGESDMGPLFTWINSIYQIGPNALREQKQSSNPKDYAATGILTLFDGCGNGVEKWTLFNLWPQAVNFGELDYSSSEEVTIELTLRYDSVEYQNCCGAFNLASCCTPCGG